MTDPLAWREDIEAAWETRDQLSPTASGRVRHAVDGVLTGAGEPVAAAGAPAPAVEAPAAVAVPPAAVGRGGGGDGFLAGALVGAAAALLGVLVGAVVARRR